MSSKRLLWLHKLGICVSWLISLIVVVSIASSAKLIFAQDELCGLLPSRLTIGQMAVVTDANTESNLYWSATDANRVELGSIPADARLLILDGPRCMGGYTWYKAQIDENAVGWVIESDDQMYLLRPVSYCDEVVIPQDRIVYPTNIITPVRSIQLLDDQRSILIASAPEDELRGCVHEINLTYQRFDVSTGDITIAEYPNRDIITRELTEKLGITDLVYGEDSICGSLIVTPDKEKVLYYSLTGEMYRYGLWIANADGTDQVEMGWVPTTFIDAAWVDSDIAYLTFMEPYGGIFEVKKVCLDGSCFTTVITGNFDLEFEGPVSVSPDGTRLAITHYPDYGFTIQSTDNLDDWYVLNSKNDPHFPAIWSHDGAAIYYPNEDGQIVQHLLELPSSTDDVEIITTGGPHPLRNEWIFLPDYRMVVYNDAGDGLMINCYDNYNAN